jgi:hypothetical protein
MNSNRINIPFSTATTFGRIYEDTTVEALQAHLTRVVNAQQAHKRHNPVYVAEVRRLNKAIAARS